MTYKHLQQIRVTQKSYTVKIFHKSSLVNGKIYMEERNMYM